MSFKKVFLCIITTLFAISLLSCAVTEEEKDQGPIDISNSTMEEAINAKINKLALGMDISQVEEILGEKPVSTLETPSSSLTIVNEGTRIYESGLSVYTLADTVFAISTNQQGVSLENGVAVGDSDEKLLQLCGNPDEHDESHIVYHSSDVIRRIVKTYQIENHAIVCISVSSLENGVPNRKFIDDEDYRINDIHLRMKEDDFLKVYTDTPLTIEQEEISSSLRDKLYKYENGVEIYFSSVDNDPYYEIYCIEFTNKKLHTNRGLKVGDTLGKVLDLYGFPLYDEEAFLSYGYEGKEYENFMVETENNIVTKITILLVL